MGNPLRVKPTEGFFVGGKTVPKSKRYKNLRALLIDARKARGLTQVNIAERLARPQSFVSKYERGEKRLDVVQFLDVTRAIGLDPKKVIDQLGKD